MKLLLIPFLALVACNAQDAGDSVTTSANTKPDGWKTSAAESSELPEALANADLPEVATQVTEAGPGKSSIAVAPVQEPQFFFNTDAISDAELKEFYLEMDITINDELIGTMTFVLWGDEAPITVRNFLRYADEGFYDGKIFHRILRDFMVQGGSSNNTGSGQGPNPMIKAEFSNDHERRHRYGVLSMARGPGPDSASSQYFLITDSDSPSTHGLDGKYASFGIMLHGVAVLERVADIATSRNPMTGEQSVPGQRAVATKVRVLRGTPSVAAEKIERPPVDLHGESERVRIQHVLISFAGTGTSATRTKEEAEALAKQVLQRAQDGEDFGALVIELTDDTGGKSSNPPGMYSLLNKGQYPPELTAAQKEEQAGLNVSIQKLQTDLLAQVNAGTKTMDDARAEFMGSEDMQKMQMYSWSPREQMVPAFGEIGFGLEVGEIGLAVFDVTKSKFGWHIIKRFE